MKKSFCVLIVIFTSAFAVSHLYAQQNVEPDIKAIRELYSQAQEFIKHDKEDPTIEYQLTLSLRRHYTVEGHVVSDYNFYFDRQSFGGELGSLRLKFVRVKITDRGGISNEEYLFNDKEELVFFFTKFKDYENSKDVEVRLYYKNGERIRNLVKTTAHGNKKVTDYVTMPEVYQEWTEIAPKSAERTKKLFKIAMDTSGDGDNSTSVVPAQKDNAKVSEITMKAAVEVLSKRLNDRTLKYLMGEENESETVDGEKTHYIRAYHESSDGESIATLGHFYIGRKSGKIYILDLIAGDDVILYEDYLKKYGH